MNEHKKINYVEYLAKDMASTKQFFSTVFNWSFTDYGPEYTAFSGAGLDGGFYQSDQCASTSSGSALIVLRDAAQGERCRRCHHQTHLCFSRRSSFSLY